MAAMHTAAVCWDPQQPPQYHTPGFAPIAVSWGWLVLGIAVGAMLSYVGLMLTGRLRTEPTIMQLGSLVQPAGAPQAVPTPMQAQARADALQYIARAGQPALQELASAARISEARFLAQLVSSRASASSNGAPPGLTQTIWQ